MVITRLQIRNFRGIEHLTLPPQCMEGFGGVYVAARSIQKEEIVTAQAGTV